MSQVLGYQNGGEAPVRRPIVELLMLAGPTIAQMASYTVMQFIDTWLLSRTGDMAATAASNSGMFAFSGISLGFGVLLLVNTLVSQNFGRRNYRECGRYMWQGIWFALVYAIVLQPLVPLVTWLFKGFGHPAELLRMESVYLRIVIAAAIIKFMGIALGQFQLAIDRPKFVTISAIAGVITNAIAAYAMILGRLGMPKMGVAGAAWGQNIGVTVETLCLMVFAFQGTVRRQFNVLDWRPRLKEFVQLVKVGVPSGVQIVAEVLAWSMFSAGVVGIFGEPAMAANTYMIRFMAVSFMPCYGIATAVTALVGRYIGRGQPEAAEQRAHLGFKVALAYMLTCCAVFTAGRWWLVGFFSHDPEVLRLGAVLMIVAGFYEIFDAMYIVYGGALRGAGDTFIPAVATGMLCWTVMVLGGYGMAREWPGLGVYGPWIAATIYGIILGFFMLTRFQLGRWKTLHLAEAAASQSEPPSATVSTPLLRRGLTTDN